MCGIAYAHDIKGKENVVEIAYSMALALQHRGQHGAGIAVGNVNLTCIKARESVVQVIGSRLHSLHSSDALVHTKYRTSGTDSELTLQPFIHLDPDPTNSFAMVFNGNIANAPKVRKQLKSEGYSFATDVDTEVIQQCILRSLRDRQLSVREMLINLEADLDGSFCLALMDENRRAVMYRSANGIRPLSYGVTAGGVLLAASEDVAFHEIDKDMVANDIQPGSALFVDGSNYVVTEIITDTRKRYPCIFEYPYFANSNSRLDGVLVKETRKDAGLKLAQLEANIIQGAVVVPIPNSSIPAARGFSERTKLDYKDAITAIGDGRTFIAGNDKRDEDIENKYIFEAEKIINQDIYLIDDSIVRGNTLKKIIPILRRLGAKSIHVRVAFSPILAPCFYGIDFATCSELIARKYSKTDIFTDELPDDVLQAIAADLGVDSIKFLPVSAAIEIMDPKQEGRCTACITGQYPTPEGQRLYAIETVGHK